MAVVVSRARAASVALRIWQAERGISSKELAAELGCSSTQVSDYRRGAAKPGRALAVRLERVTEGRVPVASWDQE